MSDQDKKVTGNNNVKKNVVSPFKVTIPTEVTKALFNTNKKSDVVVVQVEYGVQVTNSE